MRAIDDTKSDLLMKKCSIDWFGSILKKLCDVGLKTEKFLIDDNTLLDRIKMPNMDLFRWISEVERTSHSNVN